MKRNKNNKQLNPTVNDVHMYVRECVPATNECVWKIFFFFGIDGKAVPNDYQKENKQLLQSKK